MTTETTTEPTPKVAHPTAKAFFDALDSSKSSGRQSESLKRRSQSLGWRNRHSQSEFYPIEVRSSQFTVQQVQRGEIEGTYGTGATVWPAAMVLVKYMEKHGPSMIASKRVVDLGSGTGVTSVVSAILGASHVCCTDGEENVVNLAAKNIQRAETELNGDRQEDPEAVEVEANATSKRLATINNCPIYTQKLWWGEDSLHEEHGNAEAYDVILVADCVLPKLYPIAPLVQVIDELLVKPEAVAILSYEHRYYPDYHPREKFEELAKERGLVVSIIPHEEYDPIYSVDDIQIWHVKRQQPL